MKNSNTFTMVGILMGAGYGFFFTIGMFFGDASEFLNGIVQSFVAVASFAYIIAGIIRSIADGKKRSLTNNELCLASNAVIMGLSVLASFCDLALNIFGSDNRGGLTVFILLGVVPFNTLFIAICAIVDHYEKETAKCVQEN